MLRTNRNCTGAHRLLCMIINLADNDGASGALILDSDDVGLCEGLQSKLANKTSVNERKKEFEMTA